MTVFFNSFTSSSGRFSEFNAENTILFQIKVFGKITEEILLERYLLKVTMQCSCTQLRIICRKTRLISIKGYLHCKTSLH